MTNLTISQDCFVVVATGVEARCFRNRSASNIQLKETGKFTPQNLRDEGPSGVRPPESSPQETDEATISKQLARRLHQLAHSGDYDHLVLIADPDTRGELRPILHKEVTQKLIVEIDKTLINSSVADIESLLSKAL